MKKPDKIRLYVIVLTGIITALAFLILDRIELRSARRAERLAVQESLTGFVEKFKNEIRGIIDTASAVNTYAYVRPGFSYNEFKSLASRTIQHNNQILSIIYTDDLKHKYVYPLSGNQEGNATGYWITENIPEKKMPALSRVIKEKQPVVDGPVRLIQGSRAVIIRTPVFSQYSPEQVTGFVSIVVELKSLLTDAGLEPDGQHLRHNKKLLLVEIQEQQEDHPVYGKEGVQPGSPVRYTASLPGTSWEFSAKPRDGWSDTYPGRGWLALLGVLASTGFPGFILLYSAYMRKRESELRLAREAAESSRIAQSSFLSAMSHEIKTPLNVIYGLGDILLNTDLDSQQRMYLERMMTSGRILLEVMNAILEMSKFEAGKVDLQISETRVKEVIEDVAGTFEKMTESRGLGLSVTIDAEVPDVIETDAMKLRQVILHLMNNAIKFTAEGSIQVKLSVSKLIQPGLCLIISDTGIGIPREDQDRIFEQFVQLDGRLNRKFQGTGLGLSIVKHLANVMNGSIEVQSTPGSGSDFFFHFPYRQTDPVPVNAKSRLSGTVNGTIKEKIRVLLVEDTEDNRMLIRIYLRDGRFSLEEASNGLEALSRTEENEYDVILMDIQMPELDGLETTRRIRENEKRKNKNRSVIIALSAHSSLKHETAAEQAGCDDYIAKPVKRADLISKLESVSWSDRI